MGISKKKIDFKIVFEAIHRPSLILSNDLTVITVNSAFLKATSTEVHDLIGKHVSEIIPNDSNATLKNNSNSSMLTELIDKIDSAQIIRHDVLKSNGSKEEKYWHLSIKKINALENEPHYLLLEMEDVTTKKINSENIFSSEEKYRDLFENALVPMFITNPKTRKTYLVNEVGVSLFGYASKNEFLAHYNFEKHFTNPEDFETICNDILAVGQVKWDKVAMKKRDGTHFWAKLFSKSISNKEVMQTVLVDITEQKNAYTVLKISEEKYKNIFYNTLVATYSTDLYTLKATEVNDKGVALFGYQSRENFLQHFNAVRHYVNPKDHDENFGVLMEKGEVLRIVEMRRLDGSLFWGKFAIKLNKNRTLALISILDITHEVKFQEELENKVVERTLELTQSLLREKESNDLKSNFVSMVSHEFRTPLSTILSSASLINQYPKQNQQETRVKHVERIASTVKHMVSLLNDFLSLEQLRKGAISREVVSFNLPGFISEIIHEMDSLLLPKNQFIEYTHHGEESIVQSEEILKNILLNLISNASKYSEDQLPIEIYSSITSNVVTITIKDQGIGIPIEEQGKLFTEFFRASNARKIKGTGLGLSIVKKYVELLEGEIYFQSQPNEGSTFVVRFPQQTS